MNGTGMSNILYVLSTRGLVSARVEYAKVILLAPKVIRVGVMQQIKVI